MRATKALIVTEEEEALSNSLNDLPHQSRMMRQFDGNGAALWVLGVGHLPPEPLIFILNATVESLPTKLMQTSTNGANDCQPPALFAMVIINRYATFSETAPKLWLFDSIHLDMTMYFGK